MSAWRRCVCGAQLDRPLRSRSGSSGQPAFACSFRQPLWRSRSRDNGSMLRRSLLQLLVAVLAASLISAASRAEPLSSLSIADVTVAEGPGAITGGDGSAALLINDV